MAQQTSRGKASTDQEIGKSRSHWHHQSHVRHHDYSPTLGQFIERDPIGFEAGDNNWYRFVADGPTGKTDPSGLKQCCDDCNTLKQSRNGQLTGEFVLWPHMRISPNSGDAGQEIARQMEIVTRLWSPLAQPTPRLPGAGGISSGALLNFYRQAVSEITAAVGKWRDIMKKDGVDIWIKVEVECCCKKPCWMFWTRKTWISETQWIQCETQGKGNRAPAFDVNDQEAIAAAVAGCLRKPPSDIKCSCPTSPR